MIAHSLTLLSGTLLLLAANAFVRVEAQEATPAASGAAADSPATAQDAKPADAKSQSEERAAVEPAVSEPIPSATPPTGEPAPTPPTQSATAASGTKFRTMDRIELDSSAITGNRELPKVLYIVPWKKADLGDLVGRPANSLLDEVLTPVDREVFRRQTEYFSKLDTAPAGGATPPEQKAVPAPPR